ncbi:zinc finger protein draculin-like [Diorhabda carinulata]|uniref:zinc finger protein draculin-like n=1 Tax=Diorhabda carinulata TaxID=1163345 RepID=UPI0025A1DD73|nr:zinc finger protein draculin-like [Diorhabda carinulata]
MMPIEIKLESNDEQEQVKVKIEPVTENDLKTDNSSVDLPEELCPQVKIEPSACSSSENVIKTEIKSELYGDIDIKQYNLDVSDNIVDIHEENLNISFEELNALNDDFTIIENETTVYKCQICGDIFIKYQEYRLHKKNHYIEKRRCHICHKVQQSLGVLEEHVNKHLGLKPYKCEECDKCFASKNHLSLHKRCHNTSEIYKCAKCGKEFRTSASLRSHRFVHYEKIIEDFKCKVCGHSSVDETKHKLHMSMHAKKAEIKCGLCNKAFNTERGLESHLSTHNELQFPCEFCGKIYPSMYRIKRHIKRAHAPCKCEHCGQVFHDRFLYNKHIKEHSQQTKYECEYCQKVFEKAKNLSEHFRLQHKQDDEKRKCPICEKEFINKALLRNHIKTHDKCFKCKVCDKVFSSRYNLEIHTNTHSGAKNFKCDICNNYFASKTSLKNHIATHSEERKFQCEICAKTFKTSRRLYTHSQSHATEEKYQCEICLQKFRVKQYLKAHMYRHSKVKPFSCDVCQKRFKHKKTKEKHMRIGKHQQKVPEGQEEHDCDFCDETFSSRDFLLDHFAAVHHNENVINECGTEETDTKELNHGDGDNVDEVMKTETDAVVF